MNKSLIVAAVITALVSSSVFAITDQQLVDKYGKSKMRQYISKNSSSGKVTVDVEGIITTAYAPSTDYITIRTIQIDLRKLGLSATQVESDFKSERKAKIATDKQAKKNRIASAKSERKWAQARRAQAIAEQAREQRFLMAAESFVGTGGWIVDESINPINDSITTILSLSATTGSGTWGTPVRLVVMCKNNTVNVYVNWSSVLNNDPIVLTRVGSQMAKTYRWYISNDSKATFHKKPKGFLKELRRTDKLVVQLTTWLDKQILAVFNTSGLHNALKAYKTKCRW